ncbi:hypothetical protein VPH35_065908 [Triticum aestivum]
MTPPATAPGPRHHLARGTPSPGAADPCTTSSGDDTRHHSASFWWGVHATASVQYCRRKPVTSATTRPAALRLSPPYARHQVPLCTTPASPIRLQPEPHGAASC